ncbi:DUF4168 domain-containing protein [Brevundimonas sp. VNH65]|uniref:DUF4168 domain-containing protein n=1 Tax=Brevundimonas sp. VNH65 TaxID=3400917 RepID=UPI003C093FA3
MRSTALFAASLFLSAPAALAIPTLAVAQDAAAPAASVTDAQLEGFAAAMNKVREISAAVQNGAPTAEQQAAMAAAIDGAGLDIATFNALSGQVSSDPVLRARLAVVTAPDPAPGSVAAGVSEEEVAKFSTAMAEIRTVAPASGAPTADQQAAMAKAVEDSGLGLERFNAISSAVSSDAHLRARVELADAQRGA